MEKEATVKEIKALKALKSIFQQVQKNKAELPLSSKTKSVSVTKKIGIKREKNIERSNKRNCLTFQKKKKSAMYTRKSVFCQIFRGKNLQQIKSE